MKEFASTASQPRFILFGGGDAGLRAADRLHTFFPQMFGGIVWDPEGGAPPEIPGVCLLDGEEAQADILISSGYGRIVRALTLERFPMGAFNAHPSLLPAYRGRHAVQWAIDEGEEIFGVTVHRMTTVVDQGDLLLMRSCRFGLDVSYPIIAQRLSTMAAELLVELVLKLAAGLPLEPLVVDKRKDRLFRRRVATDGHVDWNGPTYRVLSRVRASAPTYPAYSRRGDGSKVEFIGHIAGQTPGEVLMSTDQGCLVATVDGVVWLVPRTPLSLGEILK